MARGEVEHLVAGGAGPEAICVLLADPAAQGGAVAAAMEERGIPFHLSGPTALFQRPEVRDAIAWLRVLADPDDSAAAARIELASRPESGQFMSTISGTPGPIASRAANTAGVVVSCSLIEE